MSVDKNLTGEQIQQIMDMLLYKALEPIILYTNAFDAQVEYLLVLMTANRKRKMTSLDREVVIESLAAYLAHTNTQKKFDLVRESRIERYFVHSFIKRFVEANKDFIEQYNKFLLAPDAEKKTALDNRAAVVGGCDRANFLNAVRIAGAYIQRFYEYRESIIEHYLKHSSKQAKAYISKSNGHLDFWDLRQSILKAVIAALDKYDSRKGALTSYINWWVMNAATSSTEHEYGIAYTVPQTQKKKLYEKQSVEINFSVSLDTLSRQDSDDENDLALHSTLTDDDVMEENIAQLETNTIMQILAKAVDNRGVARLCLDIGEHFSADDRKKMRAQMQREGLL